MSLPAQRSLSLGLLAHDNRGLFADHYLKERLQASDEWKQATGVEEAFQRIAQLYGQHAARFSSRTNEAQTEHDFIQPVLNLLWREQRAGDCYQVQVSIPNVDVRRQPDYAFFRTARERREADQRKGSLDYWRDVPCLGDAKKWTASLDKERGAEENPTAQICNYLYRSRVRWGILTNGRVWRLYEREKSSAGGIYYEVNLEELLKSADLEAFKYFYLFFRREAFLPAANGVPFVEKVFQGSVDYATEVGDRLKESVYDALRHLMNGFFEHPANGLNRHDPDTVRLVHENALIVLYRLLFLLYAEDRDLLPRNAEPYASYSLYHLQREINQHLRAGKTYPPMSHRFWGELTNLFALIDEGFAEGGIPAYNGGLFSPTRYPHVAHTPIPPHAHTPIQRWEIGDHRLAEVIDLLAYERDRWNEPGTSDVDYATLAVQHLGSIYEGLLELQPRIAEEPLVETMEDGKPVFKPITQTVSLRHIRGQPPRRINAGEVYLVTNRGERKATGSYYTPKYIVDYIVENTVGPLADEAAKKVAALRPEVDKEIEKLKRTRREWEKSSAADAAQHVADCDRLIEAQKRRLFEPYLSLKILDPAMGSGHFLVGAADFLSLAMATDPNLPDVTDDEDPQAFYKRLVVERCLYGVDLNPLAVELAKLSLWLHTVSKDKALSFLDHHLRCGNSLIGARVEDDLSSPPPIVRATSERARRQRHATRNTQYVLGFTDALTATHLQYFLDTFREIMETPSGDAATERRKDELYRAMDAVRDRFRQVANLWLAPYFGEPVTAAEYEQAVNALRGIDAEWQALTQRAWFQDAQAVAHDKRFFHWELEFPEVFFNAHGFKPKEERGFDAVIGNPPYINVLNIPEVERDYVLTAYPSAAGRVDVYIPFMEQAFRLLRNRGMGGFITPNKYMVYGYGRLLRDLLLERCQVTYLVDLARCPSVFPEAATYTAITVFRKVPSTDSSRIQCVVFEKDTPELLNSVRGPESIPNAHLHLIPVSRFRDTPQHVISPRLSDDNWQLLVKCRTNAYELGEQFKIEQCIRIGSEKVRREVILDERQLSELSPSERAKVRKVVDAEELTKYAVAWQGRYLLYEPSRLYNPKSSELLDNPKVIVKDTSTHLTVALDTGERSGSSVSYFYPLNTIYAIVPHGSTDCDVRYLATILNCPLSDYLYKLLFGALTIGGGFVRFREYLQHLPIRRITFTTPPDERARLVEEGKRLYNEMVERMAKQGER